MIVDLPDTNTGAINKKIVAMREEGGAITLGRVLTLVIAPDSDALLEESIEAANAAIQTHGGFGFAEEYDVERKFRESRLYQVAPISTNLILAHVAEHILGLPRSY